MTLAIHYALRTSERATRATQCIGRFQTALFLNEILENLGFLERDGR